jgi:hypothetical protein
VATQLVFTQQPTNAVAGVAISPAIIVTAKDAFGAVVPTYTGIVALALGANPGGATLSGTIAVTAVGGVATFSAVTLNKAAAGYTLTAVSGALAGATSTAFTITAAAAAAIAADSGNAQSAPVITPVAQQLVARVTDAFGNPVNGVAVAWAVTGGGGSLSGTTTTTDANGRVRATWTLGGTPGANTVTATSGSLAGSPVTFTATATTVATVWDLVADWSYTSPAFHDWTLGYRNGAGTFTPAPAGDSVVIGGLFGWHSTASTLRNRTAGTVNALTAQWAPGEVSFHPGPGGNDGAAIRWTSPVTGTILVTATFTGISTQAGQGTTATLHALRNGGPVWDDKLLGSVVLPIGPNATRVFSGVTAVVPGDVLEFWSDHNGQYLSDQIGVAITITGTTASAGSPTYLAFQVAPSNAVAGANIAPAVEVVAKDGFGNVVTGFTGNVTVALGANPGATALGGTTTVAAVGGVATFSTLSVPVAAAGYTLVASSGSVISSATSAAFNIAAGVAASIVADSGHAPVQSGPVGQVLPVAFVARVTDAMGNPIAGHAVAWNVTGGGGSLGVVTTTTDAAGRVRATLTLGGAPGVNTVTATATGVGTPATFTANGLVTVANKIWSGAVSTDWNTAGNWSPAGVPVATDSVLIVAGGNQPALSGSVSIARFTMQSGATLNLANFDLAAGGSVDVPVTGVTAGTGKIRMNGAGVTVVGVFPALEIFGGLTTAAGSVTVSGNLQVSGGRYDVGSGTTTVGTFGTSGTGGLLMQNGAAELIVTGAATWSASGIWDETQLTAGTLRVRGTWGMGCSGTGVFNASGTHTVVFDGTAAQTVNGGCAGGTASTQEHFRNVTLANTTGTVTIGGTAHVTGSFTLDPAVSATGGTFNLYGAFSFGAGASAGTTAYVFHQSTGSVTLPTVTLNVMTLDGGARFVAPGAGLSVGGALTAQNGAVFDADTAVSAVGSLTFNSGSRLRMRDSRATLTVNGAANFNATGVAYDDSSVTAGTLRISGTLSGACGVGTFNAAGSHILEAFGGSAQSINPCSTKGVASNEFHLQELRVNKSGGTLTLGAIDMVGKTRLMSGTLSSANATAWDSLVVSGGTLTGGGIIFRKSGQPIPPNTLGTVTLKANASIGGGVSSGAINADSGQLDVTGNATINGNFSTSRIGTLRMMTAATLTVTGTANFSGASIDGLLKAGRLEIGSHFTQGSSSSTSFAADSAHVTAFNGTGAQNIIISNPSEALARFASLEVSNTSSAGVTFTTNATVKGDFVVPGTANDSVRLNQTGSSILTVGGLNVSNTGNTRARFKGLRLVVKSFGLGALTQFDGAVFETFNTAHTQLSFEFADASTHTFNNLTFLDSPPATGFYVAMNALSTVLNLAGTTPALAANGGRVNLVAGTLNWLP